MRRSTHLFASSLVIALTITVPTSLGPGSNHLSGGIPPEPGALPNLLEFTATPGTMTAPFTGCADVTSIPAAECEVLVALYDSTNGPGWHRNTNWKQNNQPCTWYGVTCSEAHVSELNLNSNLLSGAIPPELGNLSNLQVLDLWKNQLSGAIPPELANLSNLQVLDLWSNQLSGAIPPELANLSNLEELDLAVNQLSGAVPPELSSLSNLEKLYLSNNHLSGAIPPELGDLPNLERLWMSINDLSGSIPPELGSLSNLQSLSLWDNQLSRAIPPELGNLSNLEQLDLGSNRLSGSIPPELSGLSNLITLYLGNNALSGDIPSTLTNLTGLWGLSLSYNALTASDPALVAFLNDKDPDWAYTQTAPPDDLAVASVDHESITLSWTPILYTGDGGYYEVGYAASPDGPYTVRGTTANKRVGGYTVDGLASETTYYFRVRTFTPAHGSQQNDVWSGYTTAIPGTTIGCAAVTEIPQAECEALVALYDGTDGDNWYYNTGWKQNDQPCTWYGVTCGGDHVSQIWLAGNNLVGSIPPELGDLSNLEYLSLWKNQLNGSIPPELGGLSNLEILSLGRNALAGEIPPELANLSGLTALNLGYNMLTATGDPPLSFLSSKDPDWADTQTVPPADLAVTITGGDLTSADITLTWTPILYTGDGGYYEISVAPSPEGPYTVVGTTANKMTNSCTIGGLDVGATPYLLVRTFTPAHGDQQNSLWSLYAYVLVVLPE